MKNVKNMYKIIEKDFFQPNPLQGKKPKRSGKAEKGGGAYQERGAYWGQQVVLNILSNLI